MRLESINTDVILQPMSTKQSKEISMRFRTFTNTFGTKNGEVEASETDAMEFLVGIAVYLLQTVYKTQLTLPEDYEDKLTLQEVVDFIKAQITANGPSDFLVQPLRLLLANMDQLAGRMEQMVAAETQKLLNQ